MPADQDPKTDAENLVRNLYRQVLEGWNRRSAADFASLFAEDGSIVGFDGSQVNGRGAIEAHIDQVFRDHETAAYIGIIRELRFLSPRVALLRAVSGMVPPGKLDINPAVNAVQSLVAVHQDVGWRIALFQNTPAQFHGRPDLAEALTQELRGLL